MAATSAPCSGPGAAERDQREFARIDALLHRARADRIRHVAVDDGEHAFGRARLASRPSASASSSIARCGGVVIERHAAAEEIVLVEPAEHQIGVGHGRLGAAAAIGGGAGHRAGAARPDAEGAAVSRRRRSSRRRRRWCGCRSSAPAAGSRRSRCSRASVSAKRPSTTMPMSALVPPMSKVMSLRRPAQALRPRRRRGRRRQAPTASVSTGFSATIAGVATPPFEAITRKSRGRARRRAAQPSSRPI